MFVITNFFSCSESVNGIRPTGITSSGCKKDLPNRSGENPMEYLTYEVRNNTLKITLYNYSVPCDLTKMGAEIFTEDNQIVLTPKELDGGAANCYCFMDFTFPINDLIAGDTYHCVVKGKYVPPYSFSFTLKDGVEGTINQAINHSDI